MTDSRHTPLDTEIIEPHACTVGFRLLLLGQLPFFAALSAEQIGEINVLFHEKGFAAEEVIYTAGDVATHLCVVAAGKVKLLRHSLSGQDVLIDILTQGEFFGSLATPGEVSYLETAQAQTMCCVLVISATDFQGILHRHPAVALSVLEIVTTRLREAHETVRQLSAQPAESRIATALVKLADKLGEPRPDGILIQMPLSRQDIAQMTGTTLETASRVMSQFRKEGLIRSGRQWVTVADRTALVARADEAV
jgi:CRP-like cAMP-binding protein